MSSFAMDDASDFSLGELTGQPAPEGTTGPVEPAPADNAPDEGRLRNDKGQFVAQQPAPDTQPEQPAPAVTQDPRFADDPQKVYESYTNLQSLLGRQAEELAQLRQAVQQQAWQQNQPQYDYTSIVDEDPGKAAQLAFQNGDPRAFKTALDALEAYDPTAAEVWKLRLENIAMQQRVETQLRSIGGNQQAQILENNLVALANKYPDVAQFEQHVGQVLAERPGLRQMAQSGDPNMIVQALEDAYMIAKARASDNLGAAAQTVAQAQAQANEQALQGAFVASGTNNVRQEAQPGIADALWAEWEQIPDKLGWGK